MNEVAFVITSWVLIVLAVASVPYLGAGGRHTRRAIRGHRVSVQLRRSK